MKRIPMEGYLDMAFPHLKEIATKYARAAVAADRDGDIEAALRNYRRAIDALQKIIKLYPESPVIPLYKEMIKSYSKRIKQLENTQKETIGAPKKNNGDSKSFIEEVMLSRKPSVTFNDIADLEHAKKAIREAIIYPVKRPDLYPLGWPRGILLFGPPGCGKTMLAAAVANEIDAVFMYVDASNIMSKWLGEAEKNVAQLFKIAREKNSEGLPVIIFIDEIDALLGVYNNEVGGEVRVRNQFLKEMDGLLDKDSKHHIYVIGATNKPWRLDEAFVRRFNKRIHIPLPNADSRKELLKLYTRHLKISKEVDINKLVELTEGYSGSDIRDIVIEAQNIVISEFFEKHGGKGEPREITMEDFLKVLRVRKPSVDPIMLKRLKDWAARFGAL